MRSAVTARDPSAPVLIQVTNVAETAPLLLAAPNARVWAPSTIVPWPVAEHPGCEAKPVASGARCAPRHRHLFPHSPLWQASQVDKQDQKLNAQIDACC